MWMCAKSFLKNSNKVHCKSTQTTILNVKLRFVNVTRLGKLFSFCQWWLKKYFTNTLLTTCPTSHISIKSKSWAIIYFSTFWNANSQYIKTNSFDSCWGEHFVCTLATFFPPLISARQPAPMKDWSLSRKKNYSPLLVKHFEKWLINIHN